MRIAGGICCHFKVEVLSLAKISPRQIFGLILVATLLLVMLPSALVAAPKLKVAVLYPTVKNPALSRIFEDILQGIRQNDGLEVMPIGLAETDNIDGVARDLKRNEIKAIIAIGQRSYAYGDMLSESYPVVHGGVMIEPNGHSGISLVADPHQFFDRLQSLAPRTKRVHAVYSEKSNGWLIRMAKEMAPEYGIELIAHEAKTVRQGMSLLRDTLDEVSNEQDAIWLLIDKVLPDKAALPMVLEKAWDSRVVVFSNNPSHTRRGALFALFPDHKGMGSRLGKLMIQQSDAVAVPKVLPSQDLKISINERTASHLGFNIGQSQRSEFDLIFPLR